VPFRQPQLAFWTSGKHQRNGAACQLPAHPWQVARALGQQVRDHVPPNTPASRQLPPADPRRDLQAVAPPVIGGGSAAPTATTRTARSRRPC
jgi:hypothetical protein